MSTGLSMTRRGFLAAPAFLRAAAGKRNVLFLAVDDLRPQLGCYGDRFARTPNIDKLAAAGTVFDRAYCQQAVCGPSRASLLTGLRPDTIRVYDLNTSFRVAVPDAVTLPQHFKRNGYHTENIGKVFHGNDVMNDPISWSVPERLNQVVKRDQYVIGANRDGKGEWEKMASTERVDVPDTAYIDGRVAEDAVGTLRRIGGKPFFLAVGFTKPHLPFAAPKRYWDMYDRRELPYFPHASGPLGAPPIALLGASGELRGYSDIPGKGPIPVEKARELIHGYYASASYTDANVGKVVGELERLGLRENTIIVLWGDHGWHLGEQDNWGKKTNFEIATRAPLIVSAPGQKTAGRHSRGLVEFVDIYPTLTDLCGLPGAKGLEGISMKPLLDNPGRAWKKAAFSQYPRGEKPQVMGYTMKTDRYRFTGWGGQGEELYDHEQDPRERVNIAGKAGNQPLVARLKKQLQGGWKAALPALLVAFLGIAQAQDPAKLLERAESLAAPMELTAVQTKTSTVYRGSEGSAFNLHSYITHQDGKFWAVWSCGIRNEDKDGQKICYATSADGHGWSKAGVVADDPDGLGKPGRWIARGISMLDGQLTALGAYIEGIPSELPPGGPLKWSALRLERFVWNGAAWDRKGVLIDDCMSNYPPQELGGRLFMTCRDGQRRTSVAWREPGGKWVSERVPGSVDERFSEPSSYVAADGSAHLIFRDQSRSKKLLRSVSRDKGKTWSEPVLTNYPDATSKNFTGRLSNGWYYLINNPNPAGRDPLSISFSEDGWVFSRPRALRKLGAALRMAGSAKPSRSFQYPHAMERNGSLWVIYSTNKEDIEVSEYRLADFALPQSKAVKLLEDDGLLRSPADLPAAKGKTAMVFRGEQGKSGFNLHSYVVRHEGKFWAIWSSAMVGEEDPDQHIRYATSVDGHTWTQSGVVVADPDGPQGPQRWIARGIFVYDGKLTALAAFMESADYGKRGKDEVWKKLSLRQFVWEGKQWKAAGVFAGDCMNNFAPMRLRGLLAMPCRDSRMDVYLATADKAGEKWNREPIAAAPPFHRMDEPTLYKAADGSVHMIIRDGTRSGFLIRSVSRDEGLTWTQPVSTNYPDATSKNYTGRLSNGWYYLINNPSQTSRDPLAISFSRDGWSYGRVWALRKGAPARRYEGRAKGSGSFQYPQGLEHNGSIWVIYATNKEDVEISEYPIGGFGLPQ